MQGALEGQRAAKAQLEAEVDKGQRLLPAAGECMGDARAAARRSQPRSEQDVVGLIDEVLDR